MSTADDAKFGQVAITAGGTAQQLPKTAGSTGGIVLKAHRANTGIIYVGSDNTVSSTTGFELTPGDSISLEVLNLGRIWINGATTNDRLSWGSVDA